MTHASGKFPVSPTPGSFSPGSAHALSGATTVASDLTILTKPTGTTQVSHVGPGGSIGTSDVYVYLSSKAAGTLQLGRVDNAGDEYSSGYNGAYVAGYEMNRFTSPLLRDSAGNLTTKSFGSLVNTVEPLQPGDGIRYISPTLGSAANGATFTAGYMGDGTWGVGANANATLGKTFLVKGGIGYSAANEINGVVASNTGNQSWLGASLGVKETSSGLFAAGWWSKNTLNSTTLSDPTAWLVEAGWAKNVSGIGDTTLWGHYGRDNNFGISGSQATVWALGVDQAIDAGAAHLFLTYESTSSDNTIAAGSAGLINKATSTADAGVINAQTMNSVTAGMSIAF